MQQQRIDEICRRFGVRRLQMFGSSAVGTAGPQSDVDLLVEFVLGQAPSAFQLVDMKEKLESAFDGRPVDLAFESILLNRFRRRAIVPQLQTLFG